MIIWTRSAADWESDMHLFSGLSLEEGSDIFRLPCLKISPLPEADVNRQFGPSLNDHLPIITVFTSAHAAEFYFSLKKVRQIVEKSEAIWAVGMATASHVQQHGLRVEVPEQVHGAKELGDVLLNRYQGAQVRFFLPGARLRAYNLESVLKSGGFSTLSINLYETRTGCWLPGGSEPDSQTRLQIHSFFSGSVVCFASPSAVLGFTGFWNTRGISTNQLMVVAIGRSTERVCKEYFKKVTLAPLPTLPALIETACRLRGT